MPGNISEGGSTRSGAVLIWDSGEYKLVEGKDPIDELGAGKLVMELQGKILKGGFSLVKMKKGGEIPAIVWLSRYQRRWWY